MMYNRQKLPTVQEAETLLRCFVDVGEPLAPSRYGEYEPIRTPLDPQDLSGPANMLSGTQNVFLEGTKPSFFAYLNWHDERKLPWIWTVHYMSGVLGRKDIRMERLTTFFLELCSRYPPIFALCGTGADRDAKHRVYDPETGADRGTRGLVMNGGEGLPGVYWFSYFGPALVDFFGRERLMNLPVEQVMDCGDSGVGVLVYNRPDEGTPEWRREREAAVAVALGEDYFFDAVEAMKKEPKARTPIPGVTDNIL